MRITSKGQVTIPLAMREKVGLMPNTEVEFELDGKSVRIKPAKRKTAKKKTTAARKPAKRKTAKKTTRKKATARKKRK